MKLKINLKSKLLDFPDDLNAMDINRLVIICNREDEFAFLEGTGQVAVSKLPVFDSIDSL